MNRRAAKAGVRGGFTLVELAAALAAGAAMLAGGTAMLQPAGGKPGAAPPPKNTTRPIRSARDTARQLKDATQIRSLVQAMVVYAGNTADEMFPLPSSLDRAGSTVREQGRAKDTTANIVSILIFNGSIAPEFCVSPAESSKSIRAHTNYQYSDPAAAVKPAEALWDPAFAADFTGGKTGNVSYAHLQTSDGRLGKWTNTFQTSDPIVGNRGPQIAEVVAGPDGPAEVKAAAAASNTYAIHGPAGTWDGNIGYADGHVTFHASMLPSTAEEAKLWPRYYNAAGKRTLDTFFFDEQDDAGLPAKDGNPAVPPRSNAYLGIFTKAGAQPEDFTAIWD